MNTSGLSVVPTYGGDEIQVGSKQWASKLRKQAKDLSHDLDLSYMKLAEILYYVHDTKAAEPPYDLLYRTWGYVSFKDYAEEELGLRDRKADYLRRIWFRLEVELSSMDPALKARIIALGWSKVRLLVQDDVLTILNAEEWAKSAEQTSFAVLQKMVQQYKEEKKAVAVSASEEDEAPLPTVMVPQPKAFRQKSFLMVDEQIEVLETALEKASLISGNANAKPEQLLSLIATDFVATNSVGTDYDVQLKYIAKLEHQMGLKFVVVDPDSNEVIYGISTLEKLAVSKE